MAGVESFRARHREICVVRAPVLRDGFGKGPTGAEIVHEIDSDVGLALWCSLRALYAAVIDKPDKHKEGWDDEDEDQGEDEAIDGLVSRSASTSLRSDPARASEPPPTRTASSPASTPDVELRAERPGRSDLFNGARDAAPELTPALAAFQELRGGRLTIELPELALACERVRSWADAAGHPHTAAYFGEAAARLDLENPAAANAAARCCRRVVLYERAEVWYLRARALANQNRDLGELIRSLLGLGSLMYHLGNHAEARDYLEAAKLRAERKRRLRQAAEAEHDLMLLAAEERNYDRGEFHFREALRLYPLSNPRIPYLIHDWSHFLTRLRLYRPALPLLKAVVDLLPLRSDQVLVWSTVARAAAGAGEISLYKKAVKRVLRDIDDGNQYAAPAYKNLARAAWSVSAWNDAATFASLTIEVARARREREPLEAALRLRSKLAARLPAPPEVDPPPGNMIEALHRRCMTGLQRWRPRAR